MYCNDFFNEESSYINIFCIFLALTRLGVHSLILDFSSVAVDHTLFSSNKYFAFFKMTIFYLMQKFGLQGKSGHNNLLNCLFQNANWGRAETSWCRKSLNVPHFFTEKSFKLQRIDKTTLNFYLTIALTPLKPTSISTFAIWHFSFVFQIIHSIKSHIIAFNQIWSFCIVVYHMTISTPRCLVKTNLELFFCRFGFIRALLNSTYIQGGFFYWSALKMIKCQTLRKFLHLELFRCASIS